MSKKRLSAIIGILILIVVCISYGFTFADLSTASKNTSMELTQEQTILDDLVKNYKIISTPISQLSQQEKNLLPPKLSLKQLEELSDYIRNTPKIIKFYKISIYSNGKVTSSGVKLRENKSDMDIETELQNLKRVVTSGSNIVSNLLSSSQIGSVDINASTGIGSSDSVVKGGSINVSGTGYYTVNPFGWGQVSGTTSIYPVLRSGNYIMGTPSTNTIQNTSGRTATLHGYATFPVSFCVGSTLNTYNMQYTLDTYSSI